MGIWVLYCFPFPQHISHFLYLFVSLRSPPTYQEKSERYLMLFPHVLLMLSASPRMSGFIFQVSDKDFLRVSFWFPSSVLTPKFWTCIGPFFCLDSYVMISISRENCLWPAWRWTNWKTVKPIKTPLSSVVRLPEISNMLCLLLRSLLIMSQHYVFLCRHNVWPSPGGMYQPAGPAGLGGAPDPTDQTHCSHSAQPQTTHCSLPHGQELMITYPRTADFIPVHLDLINGMDT